MEGEPATREPPGAKGLVLIVLEESRSLHRAGVPFLPVAGGAREGAKKGVEEKWPGMRSQSCYLLKRMAAAVVMAGLEFVPFSVPHSVWCQSFLLGDVCVAGRGLGHP